MHCVPLLLLLAACSLTTSQPLLTCVNALPAGLRAVKSVLRVAGALERHRRGGGHVGHDRAGELAERGPQQLLEFLLQEVDPLRA